jgi:uncharacterized protein YbaR (Trm112 family)
MQAEQFHLLRCPVDRTALTEASADLVEEINRLIRDGQLTNVAGKRVDRTIDGGLIRAAGDLLYPIVDQIPVLLRDEAISLEGIQGSGFRDLTPDI